MSELCLCKACGQPLPPQQRAGVWLSGIKARIFDYIDRYPGVTAAGIAYHFYQDESKTALVGQHVYQINEYLASTDTRVSGKEPWAKGEYQIVRGKQRALARQPRKRVRNRAKNRA